MKTIFLIRHSIKENIDVDKNVIDMQKFEGQKKLTKEGQELAYKLSQLLVAFRQRLGSRYSTLR